MGLRIWNILFVVISLGFAIPTSWWLNFTNRTAVVHARMVYHIRNEWSSRKNQTCYVEPNYAESLTDRLHHYLDHSFKEGIRFIPNRIQEVIPSVNSGKLMWVGPTVYYELDTMYYSYPYLTPKAVSFLEELGERFHAKLENTGLECSRFTLTSLLRTTHSVNRLRKRNRNSVKNSAHLHGTTFDVSYKTFFRDRPLTETEAEFLKYVLGKCIWEMRNEGKCWATYETWQTCFHVVVK